MKGPGWKLAWGHRSLVVERSPLVHEIPASKSEIWVTFHFGTEKLSLFTQQWMGTRHSSELGKVKKVARKGTGHPTSSCHGFVLCVSLRTRHIPTLLFIVWIYVDIFPWALGKGEGIISENVSGNMEKINPLGSPKSWTPMSYLLLE